MKNSVYYAYMGKLQRTDAKVNSSLIKSAVLAHFNAEGSMPTQVMVAEKTGLHLQTVKTHWKNLSDAFSDMVQPYRALTPNVLNEHYNTLIDPERANAADRKLWYQIVEGQMGNEGQDRNDAITINVVAVGDSNIQVNG